MPTAQGISDLVKASGVKVWRHCVGRLGAGMRIPALFLLLWIGPGCGTAATVCIDDLSPFLLTEDVSLPRVFSGVLYDLSMATGYYEDEMELKIWFVDVGKICAFIDAPLSLIADIALIPYTVYAQIKRGNIIGNIK